MDTELGWAVTCLHLLIVCRVGNNIALYKHCIVSEKCNVLNKTVFKIGTIKKNLQHHPKVEFLSSQQVAEPSSPASTA